MRTRFLALAAAYRERSRYGRSTESDSMGSAARSNPPWIRDAGALLALPIGLVVIHLVVPAAVRERWAFHFHEPSLFAVWMSAFLHRTVGHLLGNLVLYALVVTTAYFLFRRWNRMDEFWIMLGGFLVIMPPIITMFEYAALWYFLDVPALAADSIGFSGIGHAYAGMLAAGLGWYTADRYTTEAGVGVTFLIYTLGIAVVLTIHRGLTTTALLTIGIGLLLSAWWIASGIDWTGLEAAGRSLEDRVLDIGVLIGGITIVVIVVGAAFPTAVIAGGTATNVVAHAAGLLNGFVLAGVVLQLLDEEDLEAHPTGDALFD